MAGLPGNNEEFLARLMECERLINQNCAGTVMTMLERSFVSCDFNKRSCTYRFTVRPWMLNPAGTLHGGILATFFDNAMGLLVRGLASETESFVTTQLSLAYISPARSGESILISPRINGNGRKVIQLTAEAVADDETGRTVATASSQYYLLNRK